jgi:hypothetical protein
VTGKKIELRRGTLAGASEKTYPKPTSKTKKSGVDESIPPADIKGGKDGTARLGEGELKLDKRKIPLAEIIKTKSDGELDDAMRDFGVRSRIRESLARVEEDDQPSVAKDGQSTDLKPLASTECRQPTDKAIVPSQQLDMPRSVGRPRKNYDDLKAAAAKSLTPQEKKEEKNARQALLMRQRRAKQRAKQRAITNL